MGILDRFRAAQAERKVEGERKRAERAAERVRDQAAAEELARVAAAQEREAQEVAERQRIAEILGPDLTEMDVSSPEMAVIAIKMARLRKKELQAQKRELAAELADVREQWRDRTAGRYSMVGLGRGTGARMLRAGIQSKRRDERMAHAEVVNQFSDRRQELDYELTVVERFILNLESRALQGED